MDGSAVAVAIGADTLNGVLAPVELVHLMALPRHADDTDPIEKCIRFLEDMSKMPVELMPVEPDVDRAETLGEMRRMLVAVTSAYRALDRDFAGLLAAVETFDARLAARLSTAREAALGKVREVRLALLYCLDEDDEELDRELAPTPIGDLSPSPSVPCDLT